MIATIYKRYMIYALNKGFTKQQITSISPLATISIFCMIPKLKEEIKERVRL